MNILLTGVTGFLGRATKTLLSETLPSVKIIGVARQKKAAIGDVVCDLSDDKQARYLPTNIDCIIHLAAYVPAIEQNAEVDAAHRNNVRATLNLLEFSARHKISNFILGSSSAIYGPRNSLIPISEHTPPQLENLYAFSKLSAETISTPYISCYDMKVKILRFSYIYGTGMRESTVICKFVDAARANRPLNVFNDGHDFYDLIHVHDAAAAICAAVTYDKGGIFNIGSGRVCTLKTLAETVSNAVSSTSEIILRPGQKEALGLCLDTQHAQHTLKWDSKIPLIDGIKELAKSRKALPA